KEGQFRIQMMRAYGTRIVAGVTPGRGGMAVDGVPIYNTMEEAREHYPRLSTSVIFVPARYAKSAAFEALDGGLRFVLLVPERVPQQDMLEIIQRARDRQAVVIGPNSIGVVSPGKAIIGVIGGRLELMRTAFRPGPCGVLSRSGGQTTTLCYYLTKAGVGQSTAIGVGGDAFIGATWNELMPLFERDPETKMMAFFGEIGTTNEEDAAALIKAGGFTKPVVAYVSGRYARPGMRFGHAGAIIARGIGTTEVKIAALREAGVQVVEHLGDIGPAARRILHTLP
ncbi:MAG TPA: CoA-binding protein, partial [Candidatus Methylomirabilis sp.]|nr:CoA-binding protein [Candidatus Methylomirabilis sp.]